MGWRACLCVSVCCLGRNVWVGGGFVHVLRMFVSVCGWTMHVCVGVGCKAQQEVKPSLWCVQELEARHKMSPVLKLSQDPLPPQPPCLQHFLCFSVWARDQTASVSLCINILFAWARSLLLLLILMVSDLNRTLTTSIFACKSFCMLPQIIWIAYYFFLSNQIYDFYLVDHKTGRNSYIQVISRLGLLVF